MRSLKASALDVLLVVVQAALLLAFAVAPGRPFSIASLGSLPIVVGIAIALAGGVRLGRNLTPLPTPTSTAVLRSDGIYRWIRHPIYAGVMYAVFGISFATSSATRGFLALAIVLFFHIKTNYEERRLIARFPEYEAYRRRVKRFVPLLY
jgi:protein-S-isoprenylcysteine O-methyltransferase Ste14